MKQLIFTDVKSCNFNTHTCISKVMDAVFLIQIQITNLTIVQCKNQVKNAHKCWKMKSKSKIKNLQCIFFLVHSLIFQHHLKSVLSTNYKNEERKTIILIAWKWNCCKCSTPELASARTYDCNCEKLSRIRTLNCSYTMQWWISRTGRSPSNWRYHTRTVIAIASEDLWMNEWITRLI